jgi:hypothetical protein
MRKQSVLTVGVVVKDKSKISQTKFAMEDAKINFPSVGSNIE